MADINFDCPKCGHNLDVDDSGAGMTVPCPKCGEEIQIPGLAGNGNGQPDKRSLIIMGLVAASVFLLLLLVALVTHDCGLKMKLQQQGLRLGELEQAAQQLGPVQQELAQRNAELQQTRGELQALTELAKGMSTELQNLNQQVDDLSARLRLVDPNVGVEEKRREIALRMGEAMREVPAPTSTPAAPGKGVNGKLLVFPQLLNRNGVVLRENAEATQISGNRISFKFPGGSATYLANELHLGILGYLGVDPLVVFPGPKGRPETPAAEKKEPGVAAPR